MKYGLQLFSVRDKTPTDMEGTLRELSELGYKTVEFAGFFQHPAEEIKKWLDQYGLECSGTHTGWEEIADHFEETVAYHHTIGNKNIIIPGADLSTQEKLDAFVDFIHRFQPKLAAQGISLGYHNHSHEFLPTDYGKIIHRELEEKTDIAFEIDTYWAYHAGEDPVALLERLKDRVSVIHLKDGLADGTGKPLGMGTAPVASVYAKAKELGILMVIESETLTPSGMEEAKICADYMKAAEAKK